MQAPNKQLVIPTKAPSAGLCVRQVLKLRGPSGFASNSTAEEVTARWKGDGKVAIITGSSAGFGLESLRALTKRGCEVVAAVRNPAKMEKELVNIRRENPAAKVTIIPLDLASLASVRSFASEYKKQYEGPNILLLNAGCGFFPFQLTEDGHELQFQANYLGHFLLTQLLAPEVVKTAQQPRAPEGRIVVVSSVTHKFLTYTEGIRFDKLDSRDGYNLVLAYGQSKLCNALFARSLARRLAGQNVAAASAHPGTTVETDFYRKLLPSPIVDLSQLLTFPFLRSPKQCAATQVYCCTAPSIANGGYHEDVNLAPSSDYAKDDDMAERLWALSEKMCGI